MDSWFFIRIAKAAFENAILQSNAARMGISVPLRLDTLFGPDAAPPNPRRPFASLELVKAHLERHRLQQHADGATVPAAGEIPAGRKNRC